MYVLLNVFWFCLNSQLCNFCLKWYTRIKKYYSFFTIPFACARVSMCITDVNARFVAVRKQMKNVHKPRSATSKYVLKKNMKLKSNSLCLCIVWHSNKTRKTALVWNCANAFVVHGNVMLANRNVAVDECPFVDFVQRVDSGVVGSNGAHCRRRW